MADSEITPAELEERLGALHEESFGWALSCCGWDRTDAEDVLQTTYLRVVSGDARFGGRSSFRTWLFGVIRHVAREQHRRARVHRVGAERLSLEAAAGGGAAPVPDDPAEHAEQRRVLLDALQTTYLRVVSGDARFGGRSSFRTWLFGVIRHVAREQHRRARVHRAGAERLSLDAAAEGGAAPVPVDPAEHAEQRRVLLDALAELPARQQETLHLVFYHDLTIAEAAEVMEVSLGSARVHYERGKKRLRELLSARDIGARSL